MNNQEIVAICLSENGEMEPVAPAKKQNSATKLKNILSSGTPKSELSSLERYRKEIDACKSRKEHPGFLKKAMSSMRSFQFSPEELIDDHDKPVSSATFGIDCMLSKSHSALSNPGQGDLGNGVGMQSPKGMVRSSSSNSISKLDKSMYKKMFKKAVNMVTITSLRASEKKDEEDEEILITSREPSMSLLQRDETFPKLSSCENQQNDPVNGFSVFVDAAGIKVEDLLRIIFQSPDGMTVGDLKKLIVKSKDEKPSSKLMGTSEMLSHRSRSSSCKARRSRSSSRSRNRRRSASAGRSHSCSSATPERRRRSLGQRQGDASTVTLASSSDHATSRRQRRGSRKSFHDSDSALSSATESDLFVGQSVDAMKDTSFSRQRQRSRSRRRSSAGSIDTSSVHSCGSFGSTERRRQYHNSSEKDVVRNSLSDLLDGLAQAVDQETKSQMSQFGSAVSEEPLKSTESNLFVEQSVDAMKNTSFSRQCQRSRSRRRSSAGSIDTSSVHSCGSFESTERRRKYCNSSEEDRLSFRGHRRKDVVRNSLSDLLDGLAQAVDQETKSQMSQFGSAVSEEPLKSSVASRSQGHGLNLIGSKALGLQSSRSFDNVNSSTHRKIVGSLSDSRLSPIQNKSRSTKTSHPNMRNSTWD